MALAAQLGGAKDQRFSPRSVSKWYWVATDPAGATVTRVELDAGTDLTGAISAVSGFTESANFAETPDLASHRSGKILDGITLEDGTITFYAARDGVDAGSFFSTGDLGHLYHLPYGDTAGEPMEHYAVEVGSVSRGKEITGAKTVVVSFALNELTEETIPTT